MISVKGGARPVPANVAVIAFLPSRPHPLEILDHGPLRPRRLGARALDPAARQPGRRLAAGGRRHPAAAAGGVADEAGAAPPLRGAGGPARGAAGRAPPPPPRTVASPHTTPPR